MTGCFFLSTKNKYPEIPATVRRGRRLIAPRQISGFFFLEDAMSKKVLDFETDWKVGPALLELRALGNALVCVGLAREEASLLEGTLTNLGYMIVDKVIHVGVSLGIMES